MASWKKAVMQVQELYLAPDACITNTSPVFIENLEL